MSAYHQKLRLISGVLLPLFDVLAAPIAVLYGTEGLAEGLGPVVAEYHRPGILLASHVSVLRCVRREDSLGALAGPGRLVGHRRYLLRDGSLLVLDGKGRVGLGLGDREEWRPREDSDGAAELDLRELGFRLSLEAERRPERERLLAAADLMSLAQTHAALSPPEPRAVTRVHSMRG